MGKFRDLIHNNETPVLVDFYASWCGPCQMLTPVIEELSRSYKEKLKVIKVDIDKNPSAAQHYQVRGVPTLILFHKGKILWQQSGAPPKHELEKQLQRYI